MIATHDLLKFNSDVQARGRLFVPGAMSHPAKLHLGLLGWIVERYTRPGDTICDPMAGIGGILLAATLSRHVIAREIEARWLDLMCKSAERLEATQLWLGNMHIAHGDAREAWGYRADHIICSPPYGCDLASGLLAKGILSHKQRALAEGKLGRRWKTLLAHSQPGAGASMFFHYGRADGQIGHLRGTSYWSEMRKVYTQARVALRPDGYMVLVIKDHIRDGQRVYVADRTVEECERLGFQLAERHKRLVYPLSLWQRRRKERGQPVVEDEDVLVLT